MVFDDLVFFRSTPAGVHVLEGGQNGPVMHSMHLTTLCNVFLSWLSSCHTRYTMSPVSRHVFILSQLRGTNTEGVYAGCAAVNLYHLCSRCQDGLWI